MLKVFLDNQNAFRTLRDDEGVAILSLDIGSIIREIVEDSGEDEIPVYRAFSRIHAGDFNTASSLRVPLRGGISRRPRRPYALSRHIRRQPQTGHQLHCAGAPLDEQGGIGIAQRLRTRPTPRYPGVLQKALNPPEDRRNMHALG